MAMGGWILPPFGFLDFRGGGDSFHLSAQKGGGFFHLRGVIPSTFQFFLPPFDLQGG